MERARPFVIEGEGLGDGLTDDVTGFVRCEQLGVQRRYGDSKRVVVCYELRIESLQMIKNSLFGLLHLFCISAGDDDFYDVFRFHICCVLCQSPTDRLRLIDRLRLLDRCAERPCRGH